MDIDSLPPKNSRVAVRNRRRVAVAGLLRIVFSRRGLLGLTAPPLRLRRELLDLCASASILRF